MIKQKPSNLFPSKVNQSTDLLVDLGDISQKIKHVRRLPMTFG